MYHNEKTKFREVRKASVKRRCSLWCSTEIHPATDPTVHFILKLQV